MLGVLRHKRFRRLWSAQVVSQIGDWLNRIALLALLAQIGGEDDAGVLGPIGIGTLYGMELLVRLVPMAFVAPTLAGPIADRLPRRTLMITADVLRAVIVLGFVTIREPGDVKWLYLLLLAQMNVGVFFEAARSASVPNTVPPEELHAAYSLSAATWSVMLAVGALLGGVLVQLVGVRGVFVIDAATYLVSAAFLTGLRLPPVPDHPEPMRLSDMLLLRELRRGLAHARERRILPPILSKTFWGSAGGFLVMLAVVGEERFGSVELPGVATAASAAGLGTGILYASRGLGTGLGPILARRFLGTSDRALLTRISLGFVVGAGGYVVFAISDSLVAAAAWLVFAHTGGSSLWVAATSLWQRRCADEFRGRVFSFEATGMTAAFGVSGLVTGALYDRTGSIEHTVWAVCAWVLACGAVWTIWARRVPLEEPTTPEA